MRVRPGQGFNVLRSSVRSRWRLVAAFGASYLWLWTVAGASLAAADAAVGAVGVKDDAGSRTSWSVADVCSAMPKLRHQEGKHELGRGDGNSLGVCRLSNPAEQTHVASCAACWRCTVSLPHLSEETGIGRAAL